MNCWRMPPAKALRPSRIYPIPPADERELYDLVNDPLEQTNLVNNPLHSAVLREHEALLRAGTPAVRASRAATR